MSESPWAPITLEEMEAMHGLPHLQRALYLQLLWAADRKTCRVGQKTNISIQGLRERLEVDHVRGRHTADAGKPTRKAVLSAIDGLVKAGLIERIGNGEVLVFLLVLARRASSRLRDEGHVRGHYQGRNNPQVKQPESLDKTGFEENAAAHDGAASDADEGHISRERVNHLSKQSSSSYSMAVDNFSAGVMMMALKKNELAGLVGWLERKRGKVVSVSEDDPVIAKWARASVTGVELSEAHRIAVSYREAAKSRAPVNANYLDSILHSQVLNRRIVCKREEGQRPAVWFASATGIEAMGERHGIQRQAGESDAALKGRVAHAIALAEEAERQARRNRRKVAV